MPPKYSENGKTTDERFNEWKDYYGIPKVVPKWFVEAFYGSLIDHEYKISAMQEKFVDFCIGVTDTILAMSDFLLKVAKVGIPVVEWALRACQGVASLVGADSVANGIGAAAERIATFKELTQDNRKSIAQQREKLSHVKDNPSALQEIREDRPQSLYPVRSMDMNSISDLDPQQLKQAYALLKIMSQQIREFRKVESIRVEVSGNNNTINQKSDTGLNK